MSISSSQTRWYVANTHPGAEDSVEQDILRQGFRCFVPRQVWVERRAMRQHLKRSAFFPGYLFVSFDHMRDNWRALDATIGVQSLIMQGDLPRCCSPGFVEHFLDLADEDGVLHLEMSSGASRRHRVTRGHFSSLSSHMAKLGSSGRVQILLELMNSNINVTSEMPGGIPGAFEANNSWSGRVSGNLHPGVR